MSIYVLGVNCAYHESSVALISDRGTLAAIEEERVNRIKHAKPALVGNPDELPEGALDYCLKIGGISLADVQYIAFSFNPPKRLENNVDVDEHALDGSWGTEHGETIFHDKLMGIPDRFRAMGFKGEFVFVDHALAHAASAFYPSPFEESAIISIDGIGEVESTSLALGKNGDIEILEQIGYPHSLGFLWEKVAVYFGMSEYDACKVMSLASFGNPERFYGQFRSFIDIHEDGFTFDGSFCRFRSDDFSTFEALFGLAAMQPHQKIEQPYMDVAAALQRVTTEILLNLAQHCYKLTGSRNLCLAGGVALNCVANTAIFENGPFENIFVQPAANDAGTSLGAALHVYHDKVKRETGATFHMGDAYLGPAFSSADMEAAMARHGLSYSTPACIADEVAGLISEGHVVGWFQGRMEFGPRALGNRSLLADPRDPNMVKRMNRLVKHREDHRPFCPSVLAEHARDWFLIKRDAISARYMLMAYPVHSERHEQIPAVIHADGTSRIQMVEAQANPRYHALLSKFREKTGVPLLLNTSFNDREPIVCTPDDAIRTFLRTEIDYLALGDFLLKRSDSLAAQGADTPAHA